MVGIKLAPCAPCQELEPKLLMINQVSMYQRLVIFELLILLSPPPKYCALLETGFQYVVQAGFEFTLAGSDHTVILLPQPPECRYYKCIPPYPARVQCSVGPGR